MEKLAILMIAVAVLGGAFAEENPCKTVNGTRFITNPKGCAFYFTCVDGFAFENFCPEGFWFHERDQNCDLRHNVNCTLDVPISNFECPATGLVFNPHELICNRYVQCLNGVKTEITCPDSQEFNVELGNCVDAKFADCVRKDRIPSFCPPITRPNQVTVVKNVRSCKNFYVCTAGLTIQLECAKNMEYVPEKEWCDVTTDCKPEMPPGYPTVTTTEDCPKDDLTVLTTLPHPFICNAYFMCFGGESHLKLCGPNSKFDSELKECRPAETVECVDKPEV